MEGISKEIYVYLSNIDKLCDSDYKSLIALYGTDLVHSVIDYMIDYDKDNLSKFDYYVDRLTADVDSVSNKSNLDIYMQDIGRVPRLGYEKTAIYAKEAYDIVNELRELFKNIECKYVKKENVTYNSIIDECQFYLNSDLDKELLLKINKLYNRFIYIRNILVEGNIRLVVAASKRYFRDSNSFIEVIQWGNFGLMKAVEKYNPNYGVLFITYAYYWIRQSIRNAVRYEFNSATTISYNAIEKNNHRLKAIKNLTESLGRLPTQEEIANYAGMSERRLVEVQNAFGDSISLSTRMSSSDGEEGKASLADMFPDRQVDIEQEVYEKILHDEILKIIDEYLDEEEKYIILRRFGFYGEAGTFAEIGNEFGVSKQYIHQIQNRVLSRIKRVAGKRLVDFLD